MPNRKTHLIAGAISGAAIPLVLPRDVEEKSVKLLGDILLSASAGSVAGILPDLLEPPISPNHRDLFHSYVFGALVGYSGVKLFQSLTERFNSLDDAQRVFMIIALAVVAAFVLHLLMDSLTAKGLPLL